MFNAWGVHFIGKSNEDVKVFNYRNDRLQLQRIPGGLGNIFPNLIALLWLNGGLTTITADDLKPFGDLRMIYLENNKLVSLAGDLFKNTPKLVGVYLQNNLLQHVGYNLLHGLNDLEKADFLSNPCINVIAQTPEAIQELNRHLQIQCPSTLAVIGEYENRNNEEIAILKEENRRQSHDIAYKNKQIAEQEKMIKAMEMQLMQIWSIQCPYMISASA